VSEPDRIDAHTKIVDHVDGGLALFYRQFADKEKLKSLVRAWLTQVQAIEDAAWDILSITLDNAEDDALDQYGELLLFSRGALTSTEYRAILKAIARARKSSATPEDVIAVAKLALSSSSFIYDEGAASIVIEPHQPIGTPPDTFGAGVAYVLRLAKPGGVRVALIDPPRAETDLFTFSTSRFLEEVDSSRGWSDVAESTGGYLTGVL
jgi:hypothetical protein